MSLRDDVVLRVIHQLVEALLRAMNLRRKKELPAAEQAIGEGLVTLGLSLDVITRLDGATLANVLGEKRPLVAAALLELAAVRQAQGDEAAADRHRAVAAQLLDAGDDVPHELEAVLKSLLSSSPEDARMPW